MNGVEIALAGCLAFGQLIPQGQQEIVKHAGLQVLHADGAVTLRLKEADREKRAEGYAEVLDEFMMGGDLLVAPVMEKGAVARKVVLPPGKWLADDGKTYIGPATVEVVSPIERLPYFLQSCMAQVSE